MTLPTELIFNVYDVADIDCKILLLKYFPSYFRNKINLKKYKNIEETLCERNPVQSLEEGSFGVLLNYYEDKYYLLTKFEDNEETDIFIEDETGAFIDLIYYNCGLGYNDGDCDKFCLSEDEDMMWQMFLFNNNIKNKEDLNY